MNLLNEFLSLMDRGGPIMWVIFTAACLAMIMLVWQFIVTLGLNRRAEYDYRLLQHTPGARSSLSATSPVAHIVNSVKWNEVINQDDLARQLNISFAEVMPRLEGALPTVAMLGTLLPMLGLLGTVTGMINVFEVVAVHGSGKPEEMAFGISQALLTTASGLIFAIPVIFFHHLLTRRVNHMVSVTHRAMQIILHQDMNARNGGERHD